MPATPGEQISEWHPGPFLERTMNIAEANVDHSMHQVTRDRLIGQFLTSSEATDYTGYPKIQRAIAEEMADNELAKIAHQNEVVPKVSPVELSTITLVTNEVTGFVGATVVKRSRVNC